MLLLFELMACQEFDMGPNKLGKLDRTPRDTKNHGLRHRNTRHSEFPSSTILKMSSAEVVVETEFRGANITWTIIIPHTRRLGPPKGKQRHKKGHTTIQPEINSQSIPSATKHDAVLADTCTLIRKTEYTDLDLIPNLPDPHRRHLTPFDARFTLIPRVTCPYCQLCSIAVERNRCDWVRCRGVWVCSEFGILTEPFFDLVVPDGDSSIRSCRCERVVSVGVRGSG